MCLYAEGRRYTFVYRMVLLFAQQGLQICPCSFRSADTTLLNNQCNKSFLLPCDGQGWDALRGAVYLTRGIDLETVGLSSWQALVES